MTQPSSSSSFVGSWKYHVFLSFRGEDTRTSFTDHLYNALRREGINTFMDDQLQRGEEISTALLKAIEESKISIVVFSQNYASSKWCLEELVTILQCRQSKQQLVRPVFYKVDPSHIRNQRGSFGDAFATLQCKHNDNMDKVHKWREALTEAANLSGWTLLDGHKSEFEIIQKIVGEISEQVINYGPLDVAKYPVGMLSRVQGVNVLLDLGEDNVRMVGIWGTGGIGKTTIAKAVYNSIAHKFEGCCFLANVRESSESHAGGLVGLQKRLLSEILRGAELKVADCNKGVTLIKERLSHRKVLLVLDDVNDVKQLDNLAGESDWFGAGSRIIITTRDKKVLMAHDVNFIYDVKGLDNHEALKLFSWNAFKGNTPPTDYAELADHGIRCAGGLPLALIVLGSNLWGESLDKWKATLDGLIQSRKLQDTFKTSFNELDDSVKEVFLDIACFFKGQDKYYVTEILEACNLNPNYGIEVLIQKALISIEGTLIWMHDLLEEMGKQIVHQESPAEPGERSRVWFHEDVCHVLTENTGTKAIKGIMVKLPVDDDEICLNVKSFLEMKNLKIFINHNARIYGDFGNPPNKLRVLDWYRCELQSFPKELVVLKLPFGRIKLPAECFKRYFTKLTILNLGDSEYLTQILDLLGFPNLRDLPAGCCRNLVEVDPSVGHPDKFEVLDFWGFTNHRKFPKELSLKSLKHSSISECGHFGNFPEIMDVVESICDLEQVGSSTQNLPSSIGHLTGLKHLWLAGSEIKELPSSIGHLTGLQTLSLCGTAIKELPSSIGQLIGLQKLLLENTVIRELPSSIGQLTRLETLSLEGRVLKELPSSIGQLIGLQTLLLNGISIKELPSSIGQLSRLQTLSLNGIAIKELPSSIGQLTGLQTLSLNGATIKELPSSIGQLTGLGMLLLEGTAIKELPSSIGHLTGLQTLSLCGTTIKELPSSIGQLTGLKMLFLEDTVIQALPSSIGQLIELQTFSLEASALKELPSSIGQLIGLQTLSLKASALKELPSSIGQLIGLQTLSLNCTGMKELPSSIGQLAGLHMFSLCGPAIKELPSSIGQLTGVKMLSLEDTVIKALPSSIGQLIGLETLSLESSVIKELPSSIGQLIGLQTLSLKASAVKELPSSIGQLIGLQTLSLTCTAMKELPSSIGQLTGLQKLLLCSTSIKELPSSIGQLIGLQMLSLKVTVIKALPSSIGQLIGLATLSLEGSVIKQLPSSIGQLIGLQTLSLECSAMYDLPSSIGQLSGLQMLSLNGLAIKELPSSIGQLSGLQMLSLNGIAIKELPASIGQLSGLQTLSLNGTAIKELPSSIGQLIGLQTLSLNGVAIKPLPSSIGQLSGLQTLSLNSTNIKKLPSSIGQLNGLQTLSLNGISIEELPSCIGQLTKLGMLSLEGTAIKELPSSIGHLTGLQTLSLNYTAIKALPWSIGHLVGLKELNLEGCGDLTNLPSSIFGLPRLRIFNLNECTKLVTLPVYTNLNNFEFSSLGLLPKLESIDFRKCRLSNMDSLANFGCSSELLNVDLSRGNFVSVPLCISKFVNLWRLVLRGCKWLEEISEPLPPNIKWIDVGDCISLERFSTLSKILKDGDMQSIKRMNLSNCQRLCDTVGMDVSKMATILLDQQLRVNHRIGVILPGSEVSEWFSCRKDIHDDVHMFQSDYACADGMRELVFEIPWCSKWENMMSLVLCVVFTPDPDCDSACDDDSEHENRGYCHLYAEIAIDEVHITSVELVGLSFDSIESASSSHVVMQRVNTALPLGMKTKADVDDTHSRNQLMPYKSLVFSFSCIRGIIKSCGVHLQTQAHISEG